MVSLIYFCTSTSVGLRKTINQAFGTHNINVSVNKERHEEVEKPKEKIIYSLSTFKQK